MIYGLEKYEEKVRRLLGKVPLLKTEQVIIFLMKTYGDMSEELAASILTAIQRRGYLLLSEDGWCMTKPIYVELTGDNAFADHYSYGPFRLPPMEDLCRERNKKVTDIMWLIADLAPLSEDFFLTGAPWDAAFVDEGDEDRPSRIYEFIHISERAENAMMEMLRILPKIEEKEERDAIVRIAVMENGTHSWKIPRRGFRSIVEIDDESPTHYRIAEKREGKEVWADE